MPVTGPVTYLDHAATSPMRPEVVEAMAPFALVRYGNASGSHRVARAARKALEDAREEVAEHLGAAPNEVIFTSGGTEADNLAVFGSLGGRLGAGAGAEMSVVVCSAIEHAAVLESCRAAATRRMGGQSEGGRVEMIEAPVDGDGLVEAETLATILDGYRGDVSLVSIMAVNNEVGTIQPLSQLIDTVRRHAPGATFHTDAVQATAWLDRTGATSRADMCSVSAHKIGGPMGIGALLLRHGVSLRPLLYGGGQEQERRSGTSDVPGAVGFAAALRAVAANRLVETERVGELRNRLADGLLATVPDTVESADRDRVVPGHCHLRFRGVEQEELLLLLDEAGVCAAAGAACASGALEPSHVLLAMGVPAAEARSGIRFTLGHTTTDGDIDHALEVVPGAVARLRS